VVKVPVATNTTHQQHAPGADLIGYRAGNRLCQTPPELPEGKRQADAVGAPTETADVDIS